MTAERSAYLRDVAEDALSWVKDTENVRYRIEEAGILDPDGVWVLAHAIPELLDELEALRREQESYRSGVRAAGRRAKQERDSLAALVVRLREALDRTDSALGTLHVDCGPPSNAYYMNSYRDACEESSKCREANEALLAATEAAATTWLEADRREQRLVGAREFVRRWNPELLTAPSISGVLEAMERDA